MLKYGEAANGLIRDAKLAGQSRNLQKNIDVLAIGHERRLPDKKRIIYFSKSLFPQSVFKKLRLLPRNRYYS